MLIKVYATNVLNTVTNVLAKEHVQNVITNTTYLTVIKNVLINVMMDGYLIKEDASSARVSAKNV